MKSVELQTNLVAGRDDIGQGHPATVGRSLEVTEHAAALADEGQSRLGFRAEAARLGREQHVQHHAVDIVGDAEAVRTDDGEAALARQRGDLVLHLLFADLGEARGKHHGRAHPALHARGHGVAHAGGRQRENGKVHALRQLLGALENRPAFDWLGAPSDQMDVAFEVVQLQRLQDDLARAAGARRHTDDRQRSGTQELGDRFRTAGDFRTVHFASLSGWNMNRCVPSSSGCQ